MPNDLQVNADLEKSFRSYDQEVTINNIQLGCLLGMILMPAGAILDFFVYPSRVTFFLELRLACSALIGLFWIYVRSQTGRKKHRFLGVLLAMFPAFFISWMVLATDGAASKYYAGLNLVLLVVGFILHWTVRESLTATAAVLAMYMVACFGNDPYFLKEHRGDFANNLYFLILTGIIVVAGSGYHFRLRFREYALLFELDKSKKEIEQNHRKLQEIDQVKSRFFANISHELRTPLTLLLAPLESLAPFARRSLPPDKVELITTMQANGMRLLKLINDLLDLVRLESGRMQVKQEPLNVEAFIGGLIQSIKNVAMDKRIEVRSYIGHDVGNVLADRDKWEKILLNLMFNAIKFTPARGLVSVRVEKEDDKLVLEVKDSGMGISKENLPNVFSRFWQADTSSQRKFQGAGIGLALVKELVEAQDGTAQVQSEVGKGTTFTITLPYLASEVAPAEEPMLFADAPSRQTSTTENETGNGEWLNTLYRRAEFFPSMNPVQESLRPFETVQRNGAPSVLIADDEPDMLRFLKSQLQPRYQVIEAVDGRQAFEKAAQFLPDLVILDMMMPEKDGLQVCRELRDRTSTRRIPIVLLTARADEETKIQSLDAGASDFLSKPFSTTELHVRVKNLIESHEYQRKLSKQNQILEATLQQLKETETQLVQSEKLAGLGRMSAGIIHEINNPLNFAKTATHLLKKTASQLPSEDQDDYMDTLKDLEEGIDRVRTIVSDLRSFSHPNAESFEEVSIPNVLTSTLRFLSHEWKDKVQITQNFAEDHTTVWGNRHQLIQLMINLLQNSIDALKKKEYSADKPAIEISGNLKEDGRYLLVIRDNGPGISPENVSRIFDPFFTTKDVGEGMGLGLSICYRIMESHQGRITVHSELGEYCEFRLDFPSRQSKEVTAEA